MVVVSTGSPARRVQQPLALLWLLLLLTRALWLPPLRLVTAQVTAETP